VFLFWTQFVVVVMRTIKMFLFWTQSVVVVMRTIKQFVLWTVSNSSNEDYKTVTVVDSQ
jgi:hypothetical protein